MQKLLVKTGELLYIITLDLYVFYQIIFASNVNNYVSHNIKVLILLFCCSLLFVKWLLYEDYTVNKLILWIVFIGSFSVFFIFRHHLIIFLSLLLIISGENIEINVLLRHILFGIIVWSSFVFLLSFAGLIENYLFYHYKSGHNIEVYTYGFAYYGTIGYCVMSGIIIFFLLRSFKCTWFEIIIMGFLNYAAYQIHTTTLAYYGVWMFIIGFIFIVKFKMINYSGRFWGLVSILLPWMLFLFTLVVVYIYKYFGLESLIKIYNGNQLISRLIYSVEAIEKYGIHFLGNDVEMYGQTLFRYFNAPSSFYIDSGYIYTLIANGVMVTILLLSLYSIILAYFYHTKKYVYYFSFALMLCLCVINNFTVNIIYNPLLLFGGNAMKYFLLHKKIYISKYI